MMDDYRIQNGKIVVLDEKERRFGKKWPRPRITKIVCQAQGIFLGVIWQYV
jgi:hypothetical protein